MCVIMAARSAGLDGTQAKATTASPTQPVRTLQRKAKGLWNVWSRLIPEGHLHLSPGTHVPIAHTKR